MLDTDNKCIIRVAHDKSASRHFEGHGIISTEYQKYRYQDARRVPCPKQSIEELEEIASRPCPPFNDSTIKHMDYRNKVPTPFISATTDILWALWEAGRQKTRNMTGITIFVIDNNVVRRCVEPAVEKIKTFFRTRPDAIPKDMQEEYLNYASCSSEVIISHCIPERAIVSRVPWDELERHLPSWFFNDSGKMIATAAKISKFTHWKDFKVHSRRGELRRKASSGEWLARECREAANFAHSLLTPRCCFDNGSLAPGVEDGVKEGEIKRRRLSLMRRSALLAISSAMTSVGKVLRGSMR